MDGKHDDTTATAASRQNAGEGGACAVSTTPTSQNQSQNICDVKLPPIQTSTPINASPAPGTSSASSAMAPGPAVAPAGAPKPTKSVSAARPRASPLPYKKPKLVRQNAMRATPPSSVSPSTTLSTASTPSPNFVGAPVASAGVKGTNGTMDEKVDGLIDTVRQFIGAVDTARVQPVDPEVEIPSMFRTHYDGAVVAALRALGVGSEPKSMDEPETAILVRSDVKIWNRDGSSDDRFREEVLANMHSMGMSQQRWGLSSTVVQYIRKTTEGSTDELQCTYQKGCKCTYCMDLRLSQHLTCQMRRKNPRYVDYLRIENAMYGLIRRKPLLVRVPIMIVQEYLRQNIMKPWSDAEFNSFWEDAITRFNVNCTNRLVEQMTTLSFVRDLYFHTHYRMSSHMPVN